MAKAIDQLVVDKTRSISDAVRNPLAGPATLADLIVWLLILGLGAMQFALYERATDFVHDANYFELARSILDNGSYGYNFKPETVLPPGLPLILALMCITVGCSYTVLIRSMAVSATLGLIASYELLRRQQSRATASAACLLLGSSPWLFTFSTRQLLSDLPYFFTSITALLFIRQLDCFENTKKRLGWCLPASLFVAASILTRSAGIAFLAAIVLWLAVSCITSRSILKRRLKTFVPLLLLGVTIQAIWMYWGSKNQVLDWPAGGLRGESYISQLKLRSGNNPELGQASPIEIPGRVLRNFAERMSALPNLLTGFNRWLNPFSPIIWIPPLLILLGLGSSIRSSGGELSDWYFICYEAMYWLWPWKLELRFLLPVAPLACLYFSRGAMALKTLMARSPTMLAKATFVLSIVPAVFSIAWMHRDGGAQALLSALFWVFLGALSVCIAWTRWYQGIHPLDVFERLSAKTLRVGARALTLPQIGGIAVLTILVGAGIAGQLRIASENLHFDITKGEFYSQIEAALWIRPHAETNDVVMARTLHLVYHYSRLKVVWFPPISNPQILMDGIRKNHVRWVVVGGGEVTYWLPTDKDCFEPLLRLHPDSFHLVHNGPNHSRIFEVISPT